MNKYQSLIIRIASIKEVLNEMQDIVFLGQPIDAVDSLTFNTVIETYLALTKEVERLEKLVNGLLLCKNDSDRLNFFLKHIYNDGKTYIEDII